MDDLRLIHAVPKVNEVTLHVSTWIIVKGGEKVENRLCALRYRLCKVLKHTKQWGILFWRHNCTEVPGCIKEHMFAPGYLVPLRGRGEGSRIWPSAIW